MFEIQNLTKKYGDFLALDNVSLKISQGNITSIYGPNGAGKSTLVKILCGAEKFYEGRIIYRNKLVNFSNNIESLKEGISYIPQNFGLLHNLTGWENIAIVKNQLHPKIWYNSKKNKMDLDLVDLNIDSKILNIKVADLTNYEKQLVAILKALSFESHTYIFDECTTNLNSRDFNRFSKILLNLKEKGKTIIFISHKIDEVLEISDNIVILKNGQLISHVNRNLISKEDIIHDFVPSNIETKRSENIPNKKVNYHISLKDCFDLDFQLVPGQITVIETNDTARNQSIGYEIYRRLLKHSSITTAIIPGARDTEAIFPNLSVRENLLLNAFQPKHRFLISKSSDTSIAKITNKLDIKYENLKQKITELSGGNQQKIAFARWMIADFDIMVLIEPTSGIDLKAKEIIHNTILEMVADGKSFILVSSDEGEKLKLSCNNIRVAL